MHPDMEDLPPPTPPGMFIFFLVHLIPTITLEVSTLISPIFQVGKLRHRKLVMYPRTSQWIWTQAVGAFGHPSYLQTQFIGLDTGRAGQASIEAEGHFAQIIGNPAKGYFILCFTEEKFEIQKC